MPLILVFSIMFPPPIPTIEPIKPAARETPKAIRISVSIYTSYNKFAAI